MKPLSAVKTMCATVFELCCFVRRYFHFKTQHLARLFFWDSEIQPGSVLHRQGVSLKI
jgi:hypothetical protein